MKDNTKSCIAFLAVISISCLLAWLGGYNFDHRNETVAVVTMVALVFASLAALLIRSDFP